MYEMEGPHPDPQLPAHRSPGTTGHEPTTNTPGPSAKQPVSRPFPHPESPPERPAIFSGESSSTASPHHRTRGLRHPSQDSLAIHTPIHKTPAVIPHAASLSTNPSTIPSTGDAAGRLLPPQLQFATRPGRARREAATRCARPGRAGRVKDVDVH